MLLNSHDIYLNILKELTIEFKNKYLISIIFSFAFIVIVCISFTTGSLMMNNIIKSLLYWIIVFFTSMNSLSFTFIREIEENTALFNYIYYDKNTIFVSKLLFNIIVLFFSTIVITPLFIFFNNIIVYHVLSFIIIVLAGSISIALSTTLLAAITAIANGKGAVFSIISLPVILPTLVVCIKFTALCFNKSEMFNYGAIFFLISYSMIIFIVSYKLFPLIWREF